MDARLTELLHLLDLERLEVDLFRGESRDIGSPQVFGGQVLGQAVVAATRTVETGRELHSLHAYFLRRGDAREDAYRASAAAREEALQARIDQLETQLTQLANRRKRGPNTARPAVVKGAS